MEKDAHYPGPGRLMPAMLLVLLAACASTPSPRPLANGRRDVPGAESHRANDVLMRAIGLVGTPYRYGGNTPEGGFDCSGLVGYVFRDAAGIALPRTTGEIARVDAREPQRGLLAPGDLVLFGQRRVDHIGIYVGEGRFVHAPSSGGTVRLDHLDGPYWRDRYFGAKRLLD